jgi:hypothetical protein
MYIHVIVYLHVYACVICMYVYIHIHAVGASAHLAMVRKIF